MEINTPIELLATIENKRKNAEVTYNVIVEPY